MHSDQIRLHVFLARCGIGSRRVCERLIAQGRVTVDGHVVRTLGTKVAADGANVAVDGKPVLIAPGPLYLALHKPAGVVTTCRDPHAARTVLDLLPSPWRRANLFPVGRLDRDSTGLVLLTTDGPLAYRLSHPRYHIPKYYEVTVAGPWTEACAAAWRTGVALDDGKTAPAEVKILHRTATGAVLHVTLHEGRKRQLRRMAAAVGCQVTALVRVALGPVALGDLATGQTRPLLDEEVMALYRAVGLA